MITTNNIKSVEIIRLPYQLIKLIIKLIGTCESQRNFLLIWGTVICQRDTLTGVIDNVS